ncbi:MAG: DUF4349 domain-containing protein [Firmicutes bacterium]|nr:DUF4349 domain-containing protein [Bacillota bacterium]
MTKKQILALLLVVLVILAGCAARNSSEVADNAGIGSSPKEAFPREEGQMADGSGTGEAEQKLIRTASLSLDVEKIEESIEAITLAVKQADGFVAESSLYDNVAKRTARLVLRLPAAQLEKVLAEIKTIGIVRHSSTGSNDVTLNYIDLEARIRNLQLQEERLLEILKQAETVEDILRVEEELGRVRGELEAKTAEFRYLKDRVDYATIEISLQETVTASSSITGSGLKGVWQRSRNGFVKSINAMLTGAGNLLVALVSALPYLFIISLAGIPLYVLIRKILAARSRS